MVKGISVHLLNVIAHCNNLKILTGDIGKTFIQAPTKEKVYTKCGVEWSVHKNKITRIKQALYGHTASAAQLRDLFADFLISLGLNQHAMIGMFGCI